MLSSDSHIGQPLLEVFSICINKIHEGALIYGSLTVDHGPGIITLWTRSKENPLGICSGESILLEDLGRWISADDPLYIDLDIQCVRIADPADDEQGESPTIIAKEHIIFNPLYFDTEWGKVTRQLDGEHGSATLSYMTLPDALYAKIEVILLEVIGRDDNDDSNVSSDARLLCGTITANNGHGESELFRKVKSSSQYVTVHSNSSIPLSRAVVAAPCGGTLRVEAYLQVYVDRDVTPDGMVIEGVVEFGDAYYKKSETKIIEVCGGGRIAVKVVWMCS